MQKTTAQNITRKLTANDFKRFTNSFKKFSHSSNFIFFKVNTLIFLSIALKVLSTLNIFAFTSSAIDIPKSFFVSLDLFIAFITIFTNHLF